MEKNKKMLLYLVVGLVLIGIVVLIIYLTKKPANTASNTSNTITPIDTGCTPFTQSQQDAQLKTKYADCVKYLLNPIPIMGKVQYEACRKTAQANLQPVKNC